MSKILFVTSECFPFCKSGGLGDVAGSLPKALNLLGNDVRVVLPRYWAIDVNKYGFTVALGTMGVPMGRETIWCRVLTCERDSVKYYFIEHDNSFGRSGLYDDGKWEYFDNAERFAFFSKAALQLAKDIKFKPDVVHVNDWQTALIPAYLKNHYLHDPFFADTSSVLTIHNLAYQGVFPGKKYDSLDLGQEHFVESKFESWGKVHFLKGGIFFADSINAVSPSYAEEILTPQGGMGLAPYLVSRKEDVYGILNGVDYDHWSPKVDDLIPEKFYPTKMKGKKTCKKELQKEFLLREEENTPVIGIVTRFTSQKGLQLLVPIVRDVVREMAVQFVFLGCGDKHIEDFFGHLPAVAPGRIGAWIGFDNRKAHLIEAGSDFFLMPSMYEPCGLNQIYSMKYGTLPIVRDV
ncbi:MAG: glycogen synthase, partial [Candidatus Omnitrophica bacterium]|nr:glycogen synthase [Candidatus Omnitrophota bacterium]